MNSVSKIELEEQRAKIVDAAEKRFRTFGYGKTTMVEIADDVNMSAANLYRFFTNKQSIAAECARRCLTERVDVLREVVRRPDLSASQRLCEFVLANYRYTFEINEKAPKDNELIEIVAAEHQDLVHASIKAQTSLIAEILAYGNEVGEFAVDDIVETSASIQASLTIFLVPMFLPLYSRDQFEEMARSIVRLLIKGLRA